MRPPSMQVESLSSVGPVPASDPLSSLERELQEIIDRMSSSVLTSHTKDICHEAKVFGKELKAKMRTLRRWRNGSDGFYEADLTHLSQYLVTARTKLLDHQVAVLHERLEELDDLIRKETNMDSASESQRGDIGCEFLALHERLQSLENEDIPKTVAEGISQDIRALLEAIASLYSRLRTLKSKRIKLPSLSMKRSVSKTDSSSRHQRIEDHPLVNRLLKDTARVRRMLAALRADAHVGESSDEKARTCSDNDCEVLTRQLQRAQQWHQCVADFSLCDLENLELVVSAIERHIRSDYDLRTPSRNSVVFFPDDESLRSRQSSSSSPCPAETPPPHDLADILLVGSNNNNVSFETPQKNLNDSMDSIVDERLI